jgi:predicted DNA-binding transcriptional regulator YafY
MADTAAIRALRTMDLIPFILENPGISTHELASRFSVSQKQIEDDLSLVFLCGLPGYTPYELIDLTFEDGVVSVIDPQVLDRPRKFSNSELVVIKLGLQVLREINVDQPTKLAKIDKLFAKIFSDYDQIPFVSKNVMSSSPYYADISKAIYQRRGLKIQYQSISKDAVTERVIVPQGITVLNGNLYLHSFDLSAREERTFRLDLINKCELSEKVLEEFSLQNSREVLVELWVDQQMLNFIERNSSIIEEQSKVDNGFKVILKISNLEWISRAVLSHAPYIKVISPTSLSNEVNERIERLLENYAFFARN